MLLKILVAYLLVSLFQIEVAVAADSLALAKNSLVYIYEGSVNPCKDKKPVPVGTGFFVAIQNIAKANRETLFFLVTAKHNISVRKSIAARFSDQSGDQFCTTANIILDGAEKNTFVSNDPTVDLAIICVESPEKIVGFDLSDLADDSALRIYGIHEGDNVFNIGYLHQNPGFSRNYPTLRHGKIASMNPEKWYEGASNANEQAYIVEMDLTRGTSGSPVLICQEQIRITEDNVLQHRRLPVLVLGVVKGAPETTAPKTNAHGLIVTLDQGVTAIEPAENLKRMFQDLLNELQKEGSITSPTKTEGWRRPKPNSEWRSCRDVH